MNNLNVSLYLVTDSTYHTEESFLRTVEDACKGGVTLVQLREKNTGVIIWRKHAKSAKLPTATRFP